MSVKLLDVEQQFGTSTISDQSIPLCATVTTPMIKVGQNKPSKKELIASYHSIKILFAVIQLHG